MVKIKCNQCGRKMQIKDSNTYDGETWYGYKCQCGNVEIETKRSNDKEINITSNYDYLMLSFRTNNKYKCPKCNGIMVENPFNMDYACKKCKHVVPEEYFLIGGMKWGRIKVYLRIAHKGRYPVYAIVNSNSSEIGYIFIKNSYIEKIQLKVNVFTLEEFLELTKLIEVKK